MVTPRANPDILVCGGGTEMWMLLQVKRGVYLGSGGTVRKRKADIDKAKKDTKRIVSMAMDGAAQEAVKKGYSCCHSSTPPLPTKHTHTHPHTHTHTHTTPFIKRGIKFFKNGYNRGMGNFSLMCVLCNKVSSSLRSKTYNLGQIHLISHTHTHTNTHSTLRG